MRRILITGGAGFIGSHVTEHLHRVYPDAQITVLDKMTYAADIDNIRHILDRHHVRLVVGDICDANLCRKVLDSADLLVHLAAESHVDNSFGDSLQFTRTNTLGTHTLLEAARIAEVPKIIHVSTDEVYGEVLDGEVDESAHLNPTNPYSASKASAEMIVKSYIKSFGLPISTIRANNIFGIRQYPEKLIPRCCLSLILKQKIPIHGTGECSRCFLAAEDFAEAVALLIPLDTNGEVFNVGTDEEYRNLEVVRMICEAFGEDSADFIEHVHDRPFNDTRYGISTKRIAGIGWVPKRMLKSELGRIVEWYRENIYRYEHL